MRPIFTKVFITVICILVINSAEAQKKIKAKNADYVITAKGDTVYCVISVPFFGKNKYDTADTTAAIEPDEIKEYYIREKKEHYRSVFRPEEKKPVFIKALEIGKITLYEDPISDNVTGGYKAVWYIGKASDNVTELRRNKLAPNKSMKGQKNDLEKMLADNSDVYKAYMNDKDYSFDKIRSYIHLYNTGMWVQGWAGTYKHK